MPIAVIGYDLTALLSRQRWLEQIYRTVKAGKFRDESPDDKADILGQESWRPGRRSYSSVDLGDIECLRRSTRGSERLRKSY